MPGPGYRCAVAATSSNPMTVQSIISGASGRAWIRSIDAQVGATSPADLESNLYIDRITASGTATAVGSSNVARDDLADKAPESKLHKEHSVEPTYSSTPFFNGPINHRITFHIELLPGREWLLPQTAGAGLGIRWASTGTPISHTVISWAE